MEHLSFQKQLMDNRKNENVLAVFNKSHCTAGQWRHRDLQTPGKVSLLHLVPFGENSRRLDGHQVHTQKDSEGQAFTLYCPSDKCHRYHPRPINLMHETRVLKIKVFVTNRKYFCKNQSLYTIKTMSFSVYFTSLILL